MPQNLNCPVNSLDSNVTGLRYAEEECPGVLPTSPVWKQMEPNSYSDFSAENTLVAREPISATRQNQKGAVTDVDATSGFNNDLTMNNFNDLLQGFFFADARMKPDTKPLFGTQRTISAVDADDKTYTLNSALAGIGTGDLIFASGFQNNTNNGLKVVTGVTGAVITVSNNLVDETGALATRRIEKCGQTYASATLTVTAGDPLALVLPGAVPAVIAGEWLYIGGAGANSSFANNKGFARVSRVDSANNTLYLDKYDWEAVSETLSTTLHVYFGTVIRNEPDADLIVKRTYQFERTLGKDNDGTQAEYSVGATPNELTLNVGSADKVTLDVSYVALNNEEVTGAEGLKAGDRPQPTYDKSAINTSTDFHRINLSILKQNSTMPDKALFTFATDMTMTIANGVTARKAIGTLGAIGTSAGNFVAGGSITAYFTTVESIRAIRQNADVSVDCIIARDNRAQVWDIPLLSLSGGQVAVEKDEAITIPVDINGAESDFGYTMLYNYFPYVPV